MKILSILVGSALIMIGLSVSESDAHEHNPTQMMMDGKILMKSADAELPLFYTVEYAGLVYLCYTPLQDDQIICRRLENYVDPD